MIRMRFFSSIFFLSFIVLSIPIATAIGVSPAKYELDFVPGHELDLSFSVRNSLDHEVPISISLSGRFADNATLSQEQISVPARNHEEFDLNLALPESVDKPGKNILKVNIVEDVDSSGISARTGVRAIVVVHVPYPGRYAEITSFKVGGEKGGVNEGQNASMEFSVINRGKEALAGTEAEMTLSQDGEAVLEESFGDISMAPGETHTGSARLDTSSLPAGAYDARLDYHYDDVTRTSEHRFLVGYLDVDLSKHPEVVEKQGIVKFPIRVSNKWGSAVEVSGHVEVGGQRTDESSAVRLDAFEQRGLTTYLDTNAMDFGLHEGEVVLRFERVGKSDDADDPLNKEHTKRVPVTFNLTEPREAVEESPGFISEGSLLPVVIVVLVILLLVNGFFMVRALASRRGKE